MRFKVWSAILFFLMVEKVLFVYVDFIIMSYIFHPLESTHSCETESATFSWHLLLIDKVAELCLIAYFVVVVVNI